MRTVAIVGDSRGIGAALREQLLRQGVRVIGVSRTGVQREGGEHPNYQSLVFDAVAHPCDFSGFTDRLDGLVYCPGTIKLKPKIFNRTYTLWIAKEYTISSGNSLIGGSTIIKIVIGSHIPGNLGKRQLRH